MHTPQHNPVGYEKASISNMTALQNTVRFLMMHGVADDNVHMQNSLTLLDKLDLAGVENYDVHVFPDSDHSIYFHNANRIVYDSKLDMLVVDAMVLMANLCGRIEQLADQRFQRGVAPNRGCSAVIE